MNLTNMSLTIKINVEGVSENFNLYFYDNLDTIIERYSASNKGDNSLPIYFRAKDPNITIKSGITIELEDIRTIIKNFSSEDLTDDIRINNLIKAFPKITRKDIGVLWCFYRVESSITDEDLANLKLLSKANFQNRNDVKLYLDLYGKDVKKAKDKLTNSIKEYQKLDNVLNKTKDVKVEDFILETVTKEIKLELYNGESLFDIFDSIDASKNIPFVLLFYKNKTYFKIYRHIKPPDSWIMFAPENEGIYMKIAQSDFELNYFTQDSLPFDKKEDNFVDLSIISDLKELSIVFEFNPSLRKDKEIKDLFYSSLGDRLKYKELNDKQISVKGSFSVLDFHINRAIFADMVENDDVISTFLFFVEKVNTVLLKRRLYVYYSPRHNTLGALPETSTLLTVIEIPETNSLSIRLSKALNINQVNSTLKIFQKLLGRYNEKYEDIFEIYNLLIPNFEVPDVKKKKIVKIKKTGKRNDDLTTKRPDLFVTNYSTDCQQTRQPYLIEGKDEADEHIEELVKNKKIKKAMQSYDRDTLVLNYPVNSNDYYFCAPREPTDKDQGMIWPGLIVNKKLQNKDKEPFLPCCFKDEQSTKKAGGLKKYLENVEGKVKETKNIVRSWILGANKRAQEDRFAKIPYYLEQMFRLINIEDVDRQKEKVFPIMRYGVLESPDSFIHCLERVFNKKYNSSSNTEKIQFVKNVRKELSKMNFAYAKQELYDFSDTDVKNYLLEEKSYIDPSLFVSLLELKYKCNILMFKVNKEYQNGSIQIPRYSKVHLARKINPKISSILIVIYENDITSKLPYPYQCELIYNISEEKDEEHFNFKNTDILKKCISNYYDSNDVYSVSPNRAKPYTRISSSELLLQNVVSQYIDDNGKCRMLTYDVNNNMICLMVSPMPPLDQHISILIQETDIKVAQKFIKDNSMEILSQDGVEDEGLQGLWVKSPLLNYGYIPITKNTKPLSSIPYTKDNKLDPLRVTSYSERSRRNQKKKIAQFLMEYSLYSYSADPTNFEDNFVVVKDYNYEVNLLPKIISFSNKMWRNTKLIVPSKDAKERLINYVHVQLFNNKQKIVNYKNKKMINDFYINTGDFRNNINQYIFMNRMNVFNWKMESYQDVYNSNINSDLNKYTSEPYFYKNLSIFNNIVIVQNVENGDIEKAKTVCNKWHLDRTNIGFEPPLQIVDEIYKLDISYKIYRIGTENIDVYNRKTDYIVNLIAYDNGDIASVLFI